MKRGQILGLPLILIFALIVGAFILLYGAKVILDLTAEADYVDLLDNIKDIENNVETFQNYDVGSSKVYDISLPEDVEKLCFYSPLADRSNCLDDGKECSTELQETLDLIISDQYNVYLIPQSLYDINRFSIADFEPLGGNPECVSNGKDMVISAGKDTVGIQYYEA